MEDMSHDDIWMYTTEEFQRKMFKFDEKMVSKSEEDCKNKNTLKIGKGKVNSKGLESKDRKY